MTPDWIKKVKTASVSEGPPGTMGADKTPEHMAKTLLACNKDKTKLSITRYMQYVINRAGRRMTPDHRRKIKEAINLIWTQDWKNDES